MIPDILAMIPLALLLAVFCLALTRLFRSVGALATALGGLAFGLLSGIVLSLRVRTLLEGGQVGEETIPSVAIMWINCFTWLCSCYLFNERGLAFHEDMIR